MLKRPGESTKDAQELKQLLNLKIEEPENLEIDLSLTKEKSKGKSETEIPAVTPPEKPKTENFDSLKNIPSGKEGLKAIESTVQVRKIDTKLSKNFSDKPTGVPLQNHLSQISVKERTTQYKSKVETRYEDSLKEVEALFNTLSQGKGISHSQIRELVQNFLNIYIQDQCIIINLSNYESDHPDYLFNHCLRVCLLSMNIASAAGYSEDQVVQVGEAGLLADVGMMLIPSELRLKKTTLGHDEWYEIQKHPMLGLHMLEKVMGMSDQVAFVTYQHHERLDGSGYPKNRKGFLIHNYSKIVTIADVYQALVGDRLHRPGLHPYQAMVQILKMVKSGLLDDHFVRAFLSVSSLFPVGCLVSLSNGCIAKVIQGNPNSFERPVLSILRNNSGKDLNPSEIYQVNLDEEKSIQIVGTVHKRDYAGSLMSGF